MQKSHIHERRKYPRFKILVNIYFESRHRMGPSMSYDISQGGISFVSPEVYHMHDEGVIDIPQLKFRRTAKIVSVGILPDFPKLQKFGAEFTTPLMAVELSQLLKMADALEKSDRK